MSEASDYLENQILNALFGGSTLGPVTPNLALFTSDPGETGGGTEVTGANYSRKDVSSNFSSASGTDGTLSNDTEIVFPSAGDNWGTVSHVGIMDAAGNLLVYSSLNSAVNVESGDIFKIPAGSLSVTVS